MKKKLESTDLQVIKHRTSNVIQDVDLYLITRVQLIDSFQHPNRICQPKKISIALMMD